MIGRNYSALFQSNNEASVLLARGKCLAIMAAIPLALLIQRHCYAADAPLPIKGISLNEQQQLVVEFAPQSGGTFPAKPSVQDFPGPNHRLVLDFNDAVIDKEHIPSAKDTLSVLTRAYPDIKGLRYAALTNTPKPTARIVLDLPEPTKTNAHIVKLEENAVTIDLGLERSVAEGVAPKVNETKEAPANTAAPATAESTPAAPEVAATQTTSVPSVPEATTGSPAGTDSGRERIQVNSLSAGAVDNSLEPQKTQSVEKPALSSSTPTAGNSLADQATGGQQSPAQVSTTKLTETTGSALSSNAGETALPVKTATPEQENALVPGKSGEVVQPSSDSMGKGGTLTGSNTSTTGSTTGAANGGSVGTAASDVNLTRVSTTLTPTAAPAQSGADSATPLSESAGLTGTQSSAQSASSPQTEAVVTPSATTAPEKQTGQKSDTRLSSVLPVTGLGGAAEAVPSEQAKHQYAEAVRHYNEGYELHKSNKLPGAISEYKAAIAANPNLSQAYSNLGMIYNQQHNYKDALSEFHKALAIDPKDAITYNGVGAALRAQKDMVGAIKNWQTAVSLDPKLATAHYNLGTAYEMQRDYDKALECYKQAVKNDYRLGEAYYRMGLILQKKNNSEEALEQFNQALKVSAKAEYSDDARQKIALLKQKKTSQR